MYNSTSEFEVSILVNGRPIPEVHWQGRTYVEGRKNSEYSLFIRNNTNTRVLCIPSVDGLNVLNGEECGVQSPGYVIDRRSTVEIPGWKAAWAIPNCIEGSSEAGRFVFKPQGAKYYEDETYAESAGLNPTNQGTIGFMIFREKENPFNVFYNQPFPPHRPRPWDGPVWMSNTTRGFGASSGQTFDNNIIGSSYDSKSSSDMKVGCSVNASSTEEEADKHLGTGWGEAVEFHTHDVEFERANPSTPDAVFVYTYDTMRNLRRMGVPVEQFYGRQSSHESNPFPASPHISGGGCKPPPNWRRTRGRKKY